MKVHNIRVYSGLRYAQIVNQIVNQLVNHIEKCPICSLCLSGILLFNLYGREAEQYIRVVQYEQIRTRLHDWNSCMG